ncbi:MAG TPA: DUF4197 domain-containing protein [Burkholderiaceae bacterium]|nr:DUF4197 domain-containing protein [Burkholderiaceae bacterium]
MIRIGTCRSQLSQVLSIFTAALITLTSTPLLAQSLDQLSGRDVTAGLKAALDKGTTAAVESLGRTDGFWANPKVRIPLPDQLQRVRSALRLMGKAEELDALELAVNRAAEQAVPQAKTLLTNAVKSMTVDDAKQILRGADDSVTQFFKSKTASQLSERFLPIVRQVTQRSGLAQQYNALAGQGAALGLVKPEQATVERYVTQKALDGLYTMIAEEEKKIRANPLAAGSDIIRRVFGAL